MSALLTNAGAPLLTNTGEELLATEGVVGLGYYKAGYIRTGYYVTLPFEVPETPVQEGEYDLDVGQPGHAKHRTAFASTRALELAYWQPSSPFAPYDVQPIFTFVTPLGRYAFSDRAVPQAIEDLCLSFETTLVEMDPISFRSVPLAGNILGSVSAIERSQGRIVFNDPVGIWAQKMWREAIIGMPGGLFWMVKGLWTIPALVGTIGRMTYKNRQMVLFFGDFRRDRQLNTRTVIAHL